MTDQPVSRSDMIKRLAEYYQYDQMVLNRALIQYFDNMSYNNLDVQYNHIVDVKEVEII